MEDMLENVVIEESSESSSHLHCHKFNNEYPLVMFRYLILVLCEIDNKILPFSELNICSVDFTMPSIDTKSSALCCKKPYQLENEFIQQKTHED